MSSRKSEKNLDCHKKYFHLKKKKSTKRKLFALSSSTVPSQGPANHCGTITRFKEEPTLVRNSRTLISSKMKLSSSHFIIWFISN